MSEKIFNASFYPAVAILLITVLLTTGVLYGYFDDYVSSELKNEAYYIAHALKNEGEAYFEGLENNERRVTLISHEGTVIFDSGTDVLSADNHLDREEIKEALKYGEGESTRYSHTLSEKTVYYSLKLSDGNILRVSIKKYSFFTLFLALLQPITFVLVLCIVLCWIFSAKVSRNVSKNITGLDLEHPDNNETYAELTPLLLKISQQKRTIKKQIDELEKRENFRREFTANVSHELKTPLTSVIGFSELMKENPQSDDTVKEYSEIIYNEASRLLTLVNDIIKISRLDDKSIPFEIEEVDLFELSTDILRRLKPEADKQNIKFEIRGKSAMVSGAAKILYEMIYNLCDNGIKYNKDGGSLILDLSEDENTVILSVEDTGMGIPEEAQSRVFERFYRVDKSYSRKIGGTGLGLAIVKHGAMYHGAEIKLKSVEKKGTVITLVFFKKSEKIY